MKMRGKPSFSRSGLKEIEIPDKVTTLGEDAFAYCNSLATVIMGKGVTTVAKGAFYESKVKDVYVKALTPPSTSSYMFSSNPTIHVYASALSKYKASDWKNYGTIVGDLDEWEAARTTGVFAPEISAPSFSSGEGEVYDLSGRRVNSQLKKGLYIVGGKKVVLK